MTDLICTLPMMLLVQRSERHGSRAETLPLAHVDDAQRMGNSEWVGVVYEDEPPLFGPPDLPVD